MFTISVMLRTLVAIGAATLLSLTAAPAEAAPSGARCLKTVRHYGPGGARISCVRWGGGVTTLPAPKKRCPPGVTGPRCDQIIVR